MHFSSDKDLEFLNLFGQPKFREYYSNKDYDYFSQNQNQDQENDQDDNDTIENDQTDLNKKDAPRKGNFNFRLKQLKKTSKIGSLIE